MATDSHSAAQLPPGDRGPRLAGKAGDLLVLGAGAVVASALAGGLRMQFGLAPWLSILAALAAFAGLVALHILVHRSVALAALDAENQVLRDRLAGASNVVAAAVELPRPTTASPTQRTGDRQPPPAHPVLASAAANAPAREWIERAPRLGDAMAAPAVVDPWSQANEPRASHAPAPTPTEPPRWIAATAAPEPAELAGAPWPAMMQQALSGQRVPPPLPAGRPYVAPVAEPARPAAVPPPTQPVAPAAAWPQRPASWLEMPQPYVAATRPPPAPAAEAPSQAWPVAKHQTEYRGPAPEAQRYSTPVPVAPAVDGYEHLQGIIRQLAVDVSGAAAAATNLPRPGAAEAPPPAALAGSILDTASHALGDASAALGQRRVTAAPPHRSPAEDALAANRLDVLIAPIATLADRRACHYEVSVRLTTEAGDALDRADATPALRAAGALGRLDAATLPRVVRVARWLLERGRPSSVFSAIAGDSLADDGFLDVVANELGDGSPPHLVLAFAQSDVRAFGPMHFETLATMRDIGLSFAIEDVVDLDMDFDHLRQQGFAFVKLDAQVFLDGLPAAHHTMPPADLCRYLANLGLNLIVGEIADLATMARIFGMGVLLGQGQLFGSAKPIKSDILEPARSAA